MGAKSTSFSKGENAAISYRVREGERMKLNYTMKRRASRGERDTECKKRSNNLVG